MNKRQNLTAFVLAGSLALAGAFGALRHTERSTISNLYSNAAQIKSDRQNGYFETANEQYKDSTALVKYYLKNGDHLFISDNELTNVQKSLDSAMGVAQTNRYDTLGPEMRALINKGSHK